MPMDARYDLVAVTRLRIRLSLREERITLAVSLGLATIAVVTGFPMIQEWFNQIFPQLGIALITASSVLAYRTWEVRESYVRDIAQDRLFLAALTASSQIENEGTSASIAGVPTTFFHLLKVTLPQ